MLGLGTLKPIYLGQYRDNKNSRKLTSIQGQRKHHHTCRRLGHGFSAESGSESPEESFHSNSKGDRDQHENTAHNRSDDKL